MVALGDLPEPAPAHRARSRDRAAPPGGVRLHRPRTCKVLVAPMADRRRRGDRLDGHRHAAGGAVGPAAAAVQLLQAAVRAGDQPAGRRDPRRDHHGGRDHDRPRAQPVRADAGVGPPDRAARRRCCATRSWRSSAHLDGSTARTGSRRSRCRCCSPSPTAAPGWRRRSTSCARRPARRSPTAATSSSCPTAATTRELAPIPALLAIAAVHHHLLREGHAHARRPGGRDRRAARGAPLLPADRLRRQRDQPVPGVREPRRHGQAGRAARAIADKAEQELHQGGQQGRSSR